jgi:hypothetical protein
MKFDLVPALPCVQRKDYPSLVQVQKKHSIGSLREFRQVVLGLQWPVHISSAAFPRQPVHARSALAIAKPSPPPHRHTLTTNATARTQAQASLELQRPISFRRPQTPKKAHSRTASLQQPIHQRLVTSRLLRRVRIARTALPVRPASATRCRTPDCPPSRLPHLSATVVSSFPAQAASQKSVSCPAPRVHIPVYPPHIHTTKNERGSGSVRQGIAVSPFLSPSAPLVIHGPSTQTRNLLAEPSSPAHLHWHRPLPPSLSRRRAECGCQPQYQQPHWVKLPDQDCSRPGLPAPEHHQGGQGRSPQVGVTNRVAAQGNVASCWRPAELAPPTRSSLADSRPRVVSAAR